MTNKKRVFLSYSFLDKNIANRIFEELSNRKISVVSDYSDFHLGTNIIDKLRYLVESSEIILLLLSKNYFKSDYSKHELTGFLDETKKRKITIIPVVIERCNLPSELREYEIIYLHNDFKNGLEKIVQRVQTIPEISFNELTPYEFEKFIYDLLREYGFKNIKTENKYQNLHIDFIGEHYYKNPFGMKRMETWIIEVKFYKNERFSINTINQLVEYKKRLLPADIKMLLVTNSILTSVAEEYLDDIQKKEDLQIDVIDGLALKSLVAKRKRLLKKYFLL